MKRPGQLDAPLALAWSLLLTLGLLSLNVIVGGLVGASNLALVLAGPAELLLMWPAASLIARLYGRGEPRRDLALGATTPLELLVAASLGVLAHLPVGYLSALVERRFPTPVQELLTELAALTPSSPWFALGMLISVAAIVPLAEELFFRGALFTALLRGGTGWVALAVTSLAFALAHPKPRDWAALFAVALLLGHVRRVSGSIWAAVALHAAFNATTLVIVFVTRPVDVKPQESSWSLSAVGAILCAAGVWLFGRVAARRLREAS